MFSQLIAILFLLSASMTGAQVPPEVSNAAPSKPVITIEQNTETFVFDVKKNNKFVGTIPDYYPESDDAYADIFKQTDRYAYIGWSLSGFGGYIVYRVTPHRVYRLDLKTDKLEQLSTNPYKWAIFQDISADETKAVWLAVNEGEGDGHRFIITDVNKPNAVAQEYVLSMEYSQYGTAHFSPDGSKIAYAGAVGNPDDEGSVVKVLDLATGEEKTLAERWNYVYEVKGWKNNKTVDYR